MNKLKPLLLYVLMLFAWQYSFAQTPKQLNISFQNPNQMIYCNNPWYQDGLSMNVSSLGTDGCYVDTYSGNMHISPGSFTMHFNQYESVLYGIRVIYMNTHPTNAVFNVYDSNMNPTAAGVSSQMGVIDTFQYLFQNSAKLFEIQATDAAIYSIELYYFPFIWQSASSVCSSEEVEFRYDFPNTRLSWDFGDGTKGDGYSVKHKYAANGTYNVTLYIGTKEYTIDTLTTQVVVSNTAQTPLIFSSVLGLSACVNDEVIFKTETKAQSYVWSLGNESVTTKVPYYAYAFKSTGDKWVKLSITNACGVQSSDSISIFIKSNNQANANFHVSNNIVCPFDNIFFSPQSHGSTYWNFGDGNTSNERFPTHNYADTGQYVVTLISRNGCGNMDTTTQMVNVMYNYQYYPMVSIGFENGDGYTSPSVCPGTTLKFANYTYIQNNQSFYWKIYEETAPDQAIYYNVFEPAHTFDKPGYWIIEFSLKDNCGGEGYSSLSVYVDSQVAPMVNFQGTPNAICPGETVYIWDNYFDITNKYKYRIDYEDDGVWDDSTLTQTIAQPHVLFKHNYLQEGENWALVEAINECGNTSSDYIYVNVTADQARIPFYYIENTAEVFNEFPSDDFGRRTSNTDYQINIPISSFPGYEPLVMNNNFYVFVYADMLDTMLIQSPGYTPVGYAMGNFANGVTLYIPSKYQFSSIGILGVWYCEGRPMGQGPTSHAVPLNAVGAPILSIPVNYGTVGSLLDYASSGLNFKPYDGNCNSTNIIGKYESQDKFFLKFNEYYYYLGKVWPDGKEEMIDDGSFYFDQYDSTYVFSSSGNYPNFCFSYGKYKASMMNGVLTFNQVITEGCTQRQQILLQKPFNYVKYKNPNAVCPGDKIDFNVIGGKNVVWNIQGNLIPLNPTSYAYGTVGIKTVRAFVENNCGRKDTLYTYAEVTTDALPSAEFYMKRDVISLNDSLRFFPKEMENRKVSILYNWNFGDGTTSTEESPVHKYTATGEYRITLEVQNGCGTTRSERWIRVNEVEKCRANFSYYADYYTDTVYFENYSLGNLSAYFWTFGDGTTSTERSPKHFYNTSGVFNVCLSIRDTVNNCVDQVCKEVQVGSADCFANFSYFLNEATREVSFYGGGEVANAIYYWDFGDGSFSYDMNPVHTYNDGYYTVCFWVYDSITGCYADRCMDIAVGNVACKVAYSYMFTDSKTVEFYSNVVSTDSSDVSTQQFYWDFGDGWSANTANATHTFETPGYFNTCLYFYDSISNCYAQYCMPIVISGGDTVAVCKASFSYFADTTSNTVSFTDKSFNQASDFYWSFGDGEESNEQNPKHQYAKPGTYSVYFITYDSVANCYSDFAMDVYVGAAENARCQANFTYMFDEATSTLKIQNKSTGNPNLFYYDFGDGQYAYDENPTHIYAQAGQYNVCLYTYNEQTQCYAEFCQMISVKSGGVASCDANFSFFVNPDSLRVTLVNNSAGNITDMYWTFGDGSYLTTKNATHKYDYAGVYNVCLFVYDSNTQCYDEMCQEIKVGNDSCNIKADYSYFVDVQNNKVNYFNKATGNASAYYWDFGDGTTSAEENPVKTYAKPGVYYTTFAAYNATNGCIDFVWQQVQVGTPECKAHFTYKVDVATNTVKFLNDSKDASFAYWGFGDGGYSDQMNPEYQFSQPGKYWVGLVIADATGACYDYYEEIIQVGEITCSAKFETFVDVTNLTVSFKNASIGNATQMYWVFGDGAFDTIQNPVHKYDYPGYYYVGLYTYNSETNCMDYFDKLLLVGEEGKDCEAVFYYKSDPTSRSVQFNDDSRGDVVSYIWDFGDGTTSTDKNPVHNYTNNGWYYVCLTVTNSQGISNMTCKDVQVGEGCRANFIYSLDNNTRTVKFQDQSYGSPSEWKWNFGDSVGVSTEQNPVYTYQEPGYYVVQLDIKNQNGCEAIYVGMFAIGLDTTTLTAGFAFVVDTTGSKPSGYPVDYYGTSNGNTSKTKWTFGAGKAGGKAENETTLRPAYVYNEPGTYQVCLTVEDPNTGSTSTTCKYVKVGTVGIQENKADWNVKLYPNPASNATKISYHLSQSSNVNISIYDATGSKVMNGVNEYKSAGDNFTEIDVTQLTSGLYYIHINTNYGKTVEKLVVKK